MKPARGWTGSPAMGNMARIPFIRASLCYVESGISIETILGRATNTPKERIAPPKYAFTTVGVRG